MEGTHTLEPLSAPPGMHVDEAAELEAEAGFEPDTPTRNTSIPRQHKVNLQHHRAHHKS